MEKTNQVFYCPFKMDGQSFISGEIDKDHVYTWEFGKGEMLSVKEVARRRYLKTCRVK